jgi:hypothetical protein
VVDVDISLKVDTGASSLNFAGDAPDALASAADQDKALLLWSPDMDHELATIRQKVRLAGTGVDKAAV